MPSKTRCSQCEQMVEVRNGRPEAHPGAGGRWCKGGAAPVARARKRDQDPNALATYTSEEGLARLKLAMEVAIAEQKERNRLAEAERKRRIAEWEEKVIQRMVESAKAEKALKTPRVVVFSAGLPGHGKRR